MQSVSAAYKTAIDSGERTFKSAIELLFNESVVASASATAGTNVSEVCNGIYRPTDFTSVGSISISATEGWRGAAVSGSNGAITAETITVEYSPTVSAKHLWVIGRLSNFPVDFTVEIQENGSWVQVASVTGNNKWYWFLKLASTRDISAFRLKITKISTIGDKALVVECGVINKVVFTDTDVQYATLLAETNTESKNPVGTITSNEITYDVNNEEGWFTITNDGPLSGLIKPGLKTKIHTALLLPSGTYEAVTWGTFYVTDWDAPSSDVKAVVVANDKLSKILSKPAQNRLPVKNLSVAKFFEHVFTSIGLRQSEYVIDASLTRVIPVAWMSAGTVGDVLQELAIAGICTVFVDANDRIRVADILAKKTSVVTLTESGQVVDFSNTQSFSNAYSAVDVMYTIPRLSEITELARLENISVPIGMSTISNIPYSRDVGTTTFVEVIGSCTVTKVFSGTQSVTLTLNNSGQSAAIVTIVIYGRTIEGDGATVRVVDNTLYAAWPDKVLSVGGKYIQSESAATAYAAAIKPLATDPAAFYALTVRGNPAIELMDVVEVQGAYSIKTVQNLLGQVIRIQLTYDGGLDGSLLLRKPL